MICVLINVTAIKRYKSVAGVRRWQVAKSIIINSLMKSTLVADLNLHINIRSV